MDVHYVEVYAASQSFGGLTTPKRLGSGAYEWVGSEQHRIVEAARVAVRA